VNAITILFIFSGRIGLLFRQPSLATVTNIFVLPFAGSTWWALLALLLVASTQIWFQLFIDRKSGADPDGREFGDVLTFISGVTSQQGIIITSSSSK